MINYYVKQSFINGIIITCRSYDQLCIHINHTILESITSHIFLCADLLLSTLKQTLMGDHTNISCEVSTQ